MLVPDAASVQREKLPAYAPVADQEEQLEKIRSYLEKKENPVTEIPLYEIDVYKRQEPPVESGHQRGVSGNQAGA